MISESPRSLILLIILTLSLSCLIWFFRFEIFEPKISSANKYVTEKMQSCINHSDKYNCYMEVSNNLISRYPIEEILNIFDINEKNPIFFENCHSVTHYLGQAEYKRIKDLKLLFSKSSRACLGGVYHGAVEGYFMDKNIVLGKENFVETKKEVEKICGKIEDHKRQQDFIECNHGLGHAVMYVTDYNLPRALDYCDAINTNNERELCYTGALMANSDSFGNNDHKTQYVKEDDLLYPCNILKKHQQSQCYSYGTLNRFQYDLPKSIEICKSVPTEFQNACFETIGRDRTIVTADPLELKNQCYQIKEMDFRRSCIKGTSYNLMVRFGEKSETPLKYCDLLDSEFKSLCYSNVINALTKISNSKVSRGTFCNRIREKAYKNSCLISI